MLVYCTEFIFDGISSKDYDMIICSFDGNKNEEMSAGSKIEFTTFKAPNSNRWVKTGSNYSEQLTFDFQICKYKCNQSKAEPLSERELAFLMRWLVRKDYKDLQFIQEGYENIFYHCQITAQKYEVAGQCIGLSLTVLCDAPFGWSEEMFTTISSSTNTTVKLYDSSDEIGVIYPNMTLLSRTGTKDAPQTITINNKLTGTNLQIKNCIADEQITIQDMMITSNECYEKGGHETFLSDFNWKWFSIGNTFQNRVNEITVNGNCEIQLNWRVPRKAVI